MVQVVFETDCEEEIITKKLNETFEDVDNIQFLDD